MPCLFLAFVAFQTDLSEVQARCSFLLCVLGEMAGFHAGVLEQEIYLYIYIHIFMLTSLSWNLVLLPFGDGKSRISTFIFSKCPIVGFQSLIIWTPESSIMSQYDTSSNKDVNSIGIGTLNLAW